MRRQDHTSPEAQPRSGCRGRDSGGTVMVLLAAGGIRQFDRAPIVNGPIALVEVALPSRRLIYVPPLDPLHFDVSAYPDRAYPGTNRSPQSPGRRRTLSAVSAHPRLTLNHL
jgi:hypothetical protein